MPDLTELNTLVRRYDNLAEKHACSMGYIDGAYGYPKADTGPAKDWPNAYSAGYWEARKDASTERLEAARRTPVPRLRA